MESKDILHFSIPYDDKNIIIEYFKKSKGAGGQKINKTSNACRIKHVPSKTIVECSEYRERHKNKEKALKKLIENKNFNTWLKLEIASKIKGYENLEKQINDMTKEKNIKVEIFKNGKWILEGELEK